MCVILTGCCEVVLTTDQPSKQQLSSEFTEQLQQFSKVLQQLTSTEPPQ